MTRDIKRDNVISIHTSREGGDHFQPTPCYPVKISIHTSREGGDAVRIDFYNWTKISIHTSREGGDHRARPVVIDSNYISIHTSREGGDSTGGLIIFHIPDFNPHLPRGR